MVCRRCDYCIQNYGKPQQCEVILTFLLKSAKIVTEHKESKGSLDLELFFDSIYSIGSSSDFKVIEFL